MAFSLDTFATDQKAATKQVVDSIIPVQVKQLTEAYKDGLNSTPKEVINETLEKFTGIDLSQNAGIDGISQKLKSYIQEQAAGLTIQLEQQLLGCINKHIRDLMNKVPEIDFIINFEDRINQALSKFRNNLERKIDAELRKIAYDKIKVHQVTLFKQRIASKIRNICPDATPASIPEVRDFNNKVKKLFNQRQENSTVENIGDLLPTEAIEKKIQPITAIPGQITELSEKFKKEHRESARKRQETVVTEAAKLKAEVEKELEEQLNNTQAADIVISDLVSSEVIV